MHRNIVTASAFFAFLVIGASVSGDAQGTARPTLHPIVIIDPAHVRPPTQRPSTTGCNTAPYVTYSMRTGYPRDLRNSGFGAVVVLVSVSLDKTGKVIGARIFTSSGNAEIDAAGLRAARSSIYRPKRVKCIGVPATTIFRATFDPAE